MASPFSDQLFRAIADYAIQFPNAGSLGTDLAKWLAEYTRVRSTAFASVLLTSNSQESGGSAGGQRNFSQEVLIDALHCRRYDLDNTYVLPPHLADYPSQVLLIQRRYRPQVIRFSQC
jgi:hypothetical protein